MILTRVVEHVKAQNWTAIAIDFVIVVLGLIVGLQVNDWAERRHTRAMYHTGLLALMEESEANRAFLAQVIKRIGADLPVIEDAITRLILCRDGPESERLVNAMIRMSYSSIRSHQGFFAYRTLTEDMRFQDVMSRDFRRALGVYDKELHDRHEWLLRNAATIDPGVRFNASEAIGIRETDPSAKTAYERFQRVIDTPFKELCTNKPFVSDAMEFYAIHEVNLRISRELQANRDQFESTLRAEIERIR